MKFKHILLPFDGSTHSKNAAKYAINLAKLYGAKVTIVNCYEWHGNMLEISETMVKEFKANMKQSSEEMLKQAGDLMAMEGVEHKLESLPGSPGYVLTNLAKTKDYDLIIMGSHGHSDIAGLFLGSVTHKVLNTIYCPVMVVP